MQTVYHTTSVLSIVNHWVDLCYNVAHMIPGVDLDTLLAALGYGVALIIFAETGLMAGFFLPGDTLLFTAGALTGIGTLHVDIWIMSGAFFVAAIVGNTTGYLIGQKFGRKLFKRPNSRLFKQEYLDAAEKFYEKHGGKAVIFAQFIPILRTFNPIVTGISKMHYKKFITYNIVGALFWTVGITLAGYFLFQAFGQLIDPADIDHYLLPIIALILIISLIPAVIHFLHDKKRRAMIFDKIRAIFVKNSNRKEEKENGNRK